MRSHSSYDQATLMAQQGRMAEAAALFNQAIASDPQYTDALLGRAHALLGLGQLTEALRDIDQVLAAQPDHAAAHNSRGGALQLLERMDEAVASFERARALQPDSIPVHYNLGVLLMDMGRFEDSLRVLERAVQLDPHNATSWCHRSNALREGDRLPEALRGYDQAIALNSSNAEAWVGRGLVLLAMDRLEEARADFDRALVHDPGNRSAHVNAGLSAFRAGDMARGQAEYNWRLRHPPTEKWRRDFAQPLWLGREDLAGKTILLHAEQGLGDSIQFSRYAAMLAAREARVVMEVQEPLKILFARLDGVAEVVAQGEPLPAFDFHCPFLSLPLALGTTLAAIPAPIPYLAPDPQGVARWQAILNDVPKPRVGLVWSGNPAHRNDRHRSMPIQHLAPLLTREGQFISLQRDLRAGDNAWIARSGRIRHFGAALRDFSDTAALVSLLDVVISVDSAVAHLAGAMGKTTYILLPHAALDWRWMAAPSTSPWYPTARLVRQPAKDDWESAIAHVGDSLDQCGIAPEGG